MWLLPPPPSESSKSTQASRASRSVSAWPEPTSVLWALLSGKPTARPFSWRGWKTRPWLALLSGAVSFRTFRSANSAVRSISSPRGSPVSRGPTQEVSEEKPTNGGSGQRSPDSSPLWTRVRCSSKTSHSTLFDSRSGTFKTWATSCRHLSASAPATSEHPTNDTGSSLWPTATATDGKASGAAGYSTQSGRHSGTTLTDAMRLWATPRASERQQRNSRDAHVALSKQVQTWATPAARDCKGPFHTHRQGRDDLTRQAVTTTPDGPSGMDLNQEFVEMLLSFPRAWTDCTRSATQSCRRWWLRHGAGF